MSTVYRLLCLLFLCTTVLTACAGFGEDNAPRPAVLRAYPFEFQPLRLWSVEGDSSNEGFLRLRPITMGNQLFVANSSGHLASVALQDGHRQWHLTLKANLSSMPGIGEGIIALTSMKPELLAVAAKTGTVLWRRPLSNQVFASPAVAQGHVIVQTVDGHVYSFLAKTGHMLWHYDHGAPTLILSATGAPRIVGNRVLVGFSDGALVALRLSSGDLLWERMIATPKGMTEAEQLVGIAADPVVSEQTVYVVSYQGTLTALSLQTGQVRWQRPFSSDSDLALGKDLFASDSKGRVWAFDPSTGAVLWRTQRLEYRGLTAPVIFGDTLIVGDREGYLHWLAQTDGHPLAHVQVQSRSVATIVAAPAIANSLICVLTQQGDLSVWAQQPRAGSRTLKNI